MENIIHGGDICRNKVSIDFSVNINPLGIPQKIKKIFPNLTEKIEYYPDLYMMELKEKLAGTLNVPEEYLTLGNGASELLMSIVHAQKPNKIVVPVPSFLGYEHVINASDADVHFII